MAGPGIEIMGLTSTGRATLRVLGMNDEMRRVLRYELWREPIPDSEVFVYYEFSNRRPGQQRQTNRGRGQLPHDA